jgi:hypothetical protein
MAVGREYEENTTCVLIECGFAGASYRAVRFGIRSSSDCSTGVALAASFVTVAAMKFRELWPDLVIAESGLAADCTGQVFLRFCRHDLGLS